jgi:2,3-bisphosphoglycerate-independent phosphoglycerate mutase
VPFIVISPDPEIKLRPRGELADIAPTVIEMLGEMLGLEKPECMTGQSLWERPPEKPGRVLFLILDGWGYNPEAKGNLIARANTPDMDRFLRECPVSILDAAGEAVGLPPGTVGNSEVGHLHIGAGRRIYSDRARIDQAIAEGSFFKNKAFLEPMRRARDTNAALHLMGIVSFFSSHGSVNHLLALMELAAREGVKEVYIHAMLGRRGELPESGANYIEVVEKKAKELNSGKVVSVIGRYWSMDREENWDRIEKTYRMLLYGEGRPVKEV